MAQLSCHCRATICASSFLCFYDQGVNQWHLIAKPEKQHELLETLSLIPHPNPSSRRWSPHKLICKNCNADVGNDSKVGPNEEAVFCFQYKKVTLSSSSFLGNTKWSKALPLYPQIERRVRTILPPEGERIRGEEEERRRKIQNPVNKFSVRRPNLPEISELDVGVFMKGGKKPRAYQVELFVEALQKNSIIALPTGAGKTFVAAMVARTMADLNKDKIVVMLADRVPLVHQQAEVFGRDMGLKVKEFTGETSTAFDVSSAEKIENGLEGVEVLVLTAQVFLNKLAGGFPMGRCCLLIFDEAHHATKNHPFAVILREYFFSCTIVARPHLLGLTASPGGKSLLDFTLEHFKKVAAVYDNASIITPKLYRKELETFTNRANTVCVSVELTADEEQFQSELSDYLRKILAKVDVLSLGMPMPGDMLFLGQPNEASIRGELRKRLSIAITSFREDLKAVVEHGLEILSMFERSSVIGPKASRKELASYLRRLEWRNTARQKFLLIKQLGWPSQWTLEAVKTLNTTEVSSKLHALVGEIREAFRQNSNCRILVFVEKKITARDLVRLLESFPDIEKLHPGMLVGHSGFDGMSWEEEQKPTLQRFRSGLIKILVSTSVVEEGIDVTACNVVIRFGGQLSLTSVVQSRGRARTHGSRFVLLMDSQQKLLYDEATTEEENMVKALGMLQGNHTPETKIVVEKIVGATKDRLLIGNVNERDNDGGNLELDEDFCNEATAVDSKNNFVILVRNVPRGTIEKEVTDLFRGLVVVLESDVRTGRDRRCALFHVRPLKSQTIAQCYERILEEADLSLRGRKLWLQHIAPLNFVDNKLDKSIKFGSDNQEGILPLWRRADVSMTCKPSQNFAEDSKKLLLSRCTLGFLYSAAHFIGVIDLLMVRQGRKCQKRGQSRDSESQEMPRGNMELVESECQKSGQVVMSWQEKEGIIEIDAPEESVRVEIQLKSVYSPIVVHQKRKDGEVFMAVYLTVRNPGAIYGLVGETGQLNKAEEENFIHGCRILEAVGTCNVLRFEAHGNESGKLQALTQILEGKGVEVVDGRVIDMVYGREIDNVMMDCGGEEGQSDKDKEDEREGDNLVPEGEENKGNDPFGEGEGEGDEDGLGYGEESGEEEECGGGSRVGEKRRKVDNGLAGKNEKRISNSISEFVNLESDGNCFTTKGFNQPFNTLEEHLTVNLKIAHLEASLPFHVRYLLKCFLSECSHMLPRVTPPVSFFTALQKLSKEKAVWALLQLPAYVERFKWPFGALAQCGLELLPSWGPSLCPIPKGQKLVLQATVTPSRILYSYPTPIELNKRLENMVVGDELGLCFLNVKFREENGEMMREPGDIFVKKVEASLSDGIEVSGKLFRFLTASKRQMTTHSCWMTSLPIEDVKNQLCISNSYRNLVEYMDNLGEALVSSSVLCSTEPKPFPCGPIIGDYNRLYLDRTIISMLQARGIPDSIFEDLLEQNLNGLLQLVSEPEISWRAVCERWQGKNGKDEFFCKRITGRKKLEKDPLFRDMVISTYKEQVRALVEEARIWVPNGGEMLAIIDDQDVLEKGEIFVQLSISPGSTPWGTSENCDFWTLKGPCLLYHRHNTFHPGELQPFYARSDEKVQKSLGNDFKNVIVVSKKNELFMRQSFFSNSVRGPQVSIIWQESLCHVTHVEGEPICFIQPSVLSLVESRQMTKFFLSYMVFPQTRQIEDCHLVLCQRIGSFNEKSVQLGKVRQQVTNWSYFSGRAADLELLASKIRKTIQVSNSIHSEGASLLSKLQRRAESVLLEGMRFSFTGHLIQPDLFFVVSENNDYKQNAVKSYKAFQKAVQSIMKEFDCISEGDIAAGISHKGDTKEEREIRGSEAQKQFKELRHWFSVIFYSEVGDDSQLSLLQDMANEREGEASGEREGDRGIERGIENREEQWEKKKQLSYAWYLAALSERNRENFCLSFLWFVEELLVEVMTGKGNGVLQLTEIKDPVEGSLGKRITESLFSEFRLRKDALFGSILTSLLVFERIENCLELVLGKGGNREIGIAFSWPKTAFLFDIFAGNLDFDLVSWSLSETGPNELLKSSSLKTSSPPGTQLKKQEGKLLEELIEVMVHEFPGVRLVEGLEESMLVFQGNATNTLGFTVRVSNGDFMTFRKLQGYIIQFPGVLLLVRIILRWSSLAGLLQLRNEAQKTEWGIEHGTAFFIEQILQFFSNHGFLPNLPRSGNSEAGNLEGKKSFGNIFLKSQEQRQFWCEVFERISNVGTRENSEMANGKTIGDALLFFFAKHSVIRDDQTGKKEGTGREITMKGNVDIWSSNELQKASIKALHLLHLTAGIDELMTSVTHQIRLLLQHPVLQKVYDKEDYVALQLSLDVGFLANVVFTGQSLGREKIICLEEENSDVQKYGRGGNLQLPKGTEGTLKFANIFGVGSACWMLEQKLSRSVLDAKHVGTVFCFLFEGSQSNEDEIGCLKHFGKHFFLHREMSRHIVQLVTPLIGDTWQKFAVNKLRNVMWQARELFLKSSNDFDEISVILKVGSSYFLGLSQAIGEESLGGLRVADLEDLLMKKKYRPRRKKKSRISKEGGDKENREKSVVEKEVKAVEEKEGQKKRKKEGKAKAVSLSLFPHVTRPLCDFQTFLVALGFVLQDSSEYFDVTLGDGNKRVDVRLNEKLEIFHISEGPRRFLTASLNISPSIRAERLGESNVEMENGENSNGIRIYLQSERQLSPTDKLLRLLQKHSLLKQTEKQGGEGRGLRLSGREVDVGYKFIDKVLRVKKLRPKIFSCQRDEKWGGLSLSVEVSEVTLWDGWDLNNRAFSTSNNFTEVSVKVGEPQVFKSGSVQQFDEAVNGLWKAILSLSHQVL